jgi:hypothetical protein
VGNGKFWANEGTRLPRNFRTGDKILNPPGGETGRRVGDAGSAKAKPRGNGSAWAGSAKAFPHWRVSGPEARACANHPYADTPTRPYAS